MRKSDAKSVDHTNKVLGTYSKYYLSSEFSDAILVNQNVEYPVHRLVLASLSEFFKQLFLNNKNDEKIKVEAPKEAFKLMLKYFYTSKMDLTGKEFQRNLEIFELAHRFRVHLLESELEKILFCSMEENSVTNVQNLKSNIQTKKTLHNTLDTLATSNKDDISDESNLSSAVTVPKDDENVCERFNLLSGTVLDGLITSDFNNNECSIHIELQSTFILNFLTFQVGTAHYKFSVEVSADNNNWITIFAFDGSHSHKKFELYFKNLSTKYIKFSGNIECIQIHATYRRNLSFVNGFYCSASNVIRPAVACCPNYPTVFSKTIKIYRDDFCEIKFFQPLWLKQCRFFVESLNSNSCLKMFIVNNRDEKVEIASSSYTGFHFIPFDAQAVTKLWIVNDTASPYGFLSIKGLEAYF